jgi:hypothetical protein
VSPPVGRHRRSEWRTSRRVGVLVSSRRAGSRSPGVAGSDLTRWVHCGRPVVRASQRREVRKEPDFRRQSRPEARNARRRNAITVTTSIAALIRDASGQTVAISRGRRNAQVLAHQRGRVFGRTGANTAAFDTRRNQNECLPVRRIVRLPIFSNGGRARGRHRENAAARDQL